MFGDVANPTVKLGSQKWYTVPLSILAHVVLFAAVIIIPLMATDVLPTPPSMMAVVGAPALPPEDAGVRGCSAPTRAPTPPTSGSGSGHAQGSQTGGEPQCGPGRGAEEH